MNKVDPSKQVLYTSADYHHALKHTDKIKRAVSLVEGGSNVVDFSLYVSAYTELVEKLVATNDRGNDTNSKMDVAHNKLSKELQGLEKRITAASVTMGVTPPSKELMQILKINVPPVETKPVKKWTWTEIAKYSAATGAAGYLSYQLYDSIQQLPEIIRKIVEGAIKNGPKVGDAGNKVFNAGTTYVNGLGAGINQLRKAASSMTGAEIHQGDPTELGFATIINLGVTRYIWSFAKPYIIPFLGPLAPVLPIDLAIDGAIICNAVHPNCTDLAMGAVKTTINTAKEHPTALYSTGALVLPVGGYFYSDIANALSNTGSSMYTTLPFFGTRFLVTQAIDSAYPGLLNNLTETYPLTSRASNWGGTVGALSGPGLAHFTGIAKAWGETAKGKIPIPPAGLGVTDDVINGVIKIRKAAFDRGYQKAFVVSSFALGILGTGLPPAGTMVMNAGTMVMNIAQQHPIATAASITGLLASGGTGFFLSSFSMFGAAFPLSAVLAGSLGTGAATAGLTALAGAAGNMAYESYQDPEGYLGASASWSSKKLTDLGSTIADSRENGMIGTVETIVTTNPITAIGTAALPLITMGGMNHRGHSRLHTGAASVFATVVPTGINLAAQGISNSYNNPDGYIGRWNRKE